MKRKYFINGWEESRKYFLERLGKITEKELDTLANGETIERNGNYFYIENFYGI